MGLAYKQYVGAEIGLATRQLIVQLFDAPAADVCHSEPHVCFNVAINKTVWPASRSANF
jgi:hypothetical protein